MAPSSGWRNRLHVRMINETERDFRNCNVGITDGKYL
jgi:hypothetical protein